MSDLTPNPATPEGDAELAKLRALARRVEPGTVIWEAPPPGLWDRIAADADISPVPGDEHQAESLHARETVVPIDRALRHGSRRVWAGAAAAAVVLVVAVAVLVRSGSSDDSTVVAAVTLERLGNAGEGRAELVERDGSLQLRLATSGLDAGDGFLEVWVINTDVTQLVSLGPLRDDGIYDLPAGLDPASFPIVDVSVEPIDGVPTHSGDSVLRGQFTV
jgi:anti-sigma-K factor RskA